MLFKSLYIDIIDLFSSLFISVLEVAKRIGLLESEPRQPERLQLGEEPPAPRFGLESWRGQKWWALLPLEPLKYDRVVVFDTETSGFGSEDEILEIGAVEMELCWRGDAIRGRI